MATATTPLLSDTDSIESPALVTVGDIWKQTLTEKVIQKAEWRKRWCQFLCVIVTIILYIPFFLSFLPSNFQSGDGSTTQLSEYSTAGLNTILTALAAAFSHTHYPKAWWTEAVLLENKIVKVGDALAEHGPSQIPARQKNGEYTVEGEKAAREAQALRDELLGLTRPLIFEEKVVGGGDTIDSTSVKDVQRIEDRA